MRLLGLEIVSKIVANFLEILGKFVGYLWDIGATLALINVFGMIA